MATATITTVPATVELSPLDTLLAKVKVTGTAAEAARKAVKANARLSGAKREMDALDKGLDNAFGETVRFISEMLAAGVTTRQAEAILKSGDDNLLDVGKSTVGNYSTLAEFVALDGDLPTRTTKDDNGDEVQVPTHVLRPSHLAPKGMKSVYALVLKGIMPGDWKAAADAAGIKYGKGVVSAIFAASADKAEAVQGLDALYKSLEDAHKAAKAAAKDPKDADVLVKSAVDGILTAAVNSAAAGFVGDKVELAAQIVAAQALLTALEGYTK